jgi:hypothetical protein
MLLLKRRNKMKKKNLLLWLLPFILGMTQCSQEDSNFISEDPNSIPEGIKNNNASEPGRSEKLDEATERQILQAYLEKLQSSGGYADLTINDVWVEQYYGSYCPLDLFPKDATDLWDFLSTDYLDPKNHTVAAVKAGFKGMDYYTEPRDAIIYLPNTSYPLVVRFYDKSSILLWDKGQVYDMEKDQLYNVVKDPSYSNEQDEWLDLEYHHYFLSTQYFRKIINRHNGLDFETDTKIRADLGKFKFTKWSAEDYAFITILYLGTYNGYAALTVLNDAYSLAVFKQMIGGVLFAYPSSPVYIAAWKEGALYELEYLFGQGLIRHEDLVEMAYFHHGGQKREY